LGRKVRAKGEEKAFFAEPDLRGLAVLRNEPIRRSLQKTNPRVGSGAATAVENANPINDL
jgi:hypothetical protein